MWKSTLPLFTLLCMANFACADTLTATISLANGQTKATGFREIPSGRHTYIVTLQAPTIYYSSWNGGYASWRNRSRTIE